MFAKISNRYTVLPTKHFARSIATLGSSIDVVDGMAGCLVYHVECYDQLFTGHIKDYFAWDLLPPSTTVSSEVEVRVVVQVLRLNTLSKLTFADRQRFDALVRDVFTGVEFRDVEYGALEAALRETSRANNLVVIDRQVCSTRHSAGDHTGSVCVSRLWKC